jgi:hypothetical protein
MTPEEIIEAFHDGGVELAVTPDGELRWSKKPSHLTLHPRLIATKPQAGQRPLRRRWHRR